MFVVPTRIEVLRLERTLVDKHYRPYPTLAPLRRTACLLLSFQSERWPFCTHSPTLLGEVAAMPFPTTLTSLLHTNQAFRSAAVGCSSVAVGAFPARGERAGPRSSFPGFCALPLCENQIYESESSRISDQLFLTRFFSMRPLADLEIDSPTRPPHKR